MSEHVAPVRLPMTAAWGIFAGSATLAASQSTGAGTDIGAVLIAGITAAGAIGAAWVASRYRNSRRDDLDDDEVIIKRDEYDRLREMERRRGSRGGR